jgi:phosphate transport system substrate-binding protein
VKNNLLKLFLFSTLLLLISCTPTGNDNEQSDTSSQTITTIDNKGSDTIVNLALAWAERYQVIEPNVRISVTGGGSGTGIAALINGTVDLANASRQIKSKEIDNAMENGNEPVEFIIARDAIAIIVNLNNPVDELSLQQLSDIYTGKIQNWHEVGGDDRPIVLLSRESNSGTHVYFLEEVIRLGEKESKLLFSTFTLLLPSSEGITVEVRQNPNAIGYDGLGYVTDEVKVIKISGKDSNEFIYPSADSVNSGKYPIARNLYMYTNGSPEGELKIYLDWILSTEAQQIVEALGFVPVIE